MLRSGTTSAAVFATVFSQSVDAFFAQALSDNMRVLCGKVMMDRNVPPSLQESAEHSYQTSAQLIERWHGRGRLLYAVSPRFALTSSRTLLESAGRLLACYPDVYLHTHLSENREEVRQVRRLFPEAESYLALYHRYGLTGPRSLFAHSIYLDDTEWALMAESGSVALFCPSSNLFLGSGLFSMHKAKQYGVRVGLGSDIGAGNSFSLLYTLNEAYKVCQLQQYRLSALKGLYLATLGGARALSLDHLIGNFIPGKEADFVVWDWQATELQKIRHAYTNCLEEKLFALMMLGDERNVMATFIAGEQRYP
jgi:guanine deaminase